MENMISQMLASLFYLVSPRVKMDLHCRVIFSWVSMFILLHEKFPQFDWLRAVVFQLNLKYLQEKITNLLRVVV